MSKTTKRLWDAYLAPERIERIETKLVEGMAKEFASRYSPSEVSNAEVEWLLKRMQRLTRALNELVRIPNDNGFALYMWNDRYGDLIVHDEANA